MAIKITVSDRVTFAVKGTLTDDAGAAQGFDFLLTARRLSSDQLQAELQNTERKVPEFMAGVVEGWKKVLDDDGAEVPFSQQALAQLFQIPGLSSLAFSRYLSESGAKEKN